MKTLFAIPTVFATLVLGMPLPAAAEAYNVDDLHSMPTFTFTHLHLSSFRGRFEKTAGIVEFDPLRHSGGADTSTRSARACRCSINF